MSKRSDEILVKDILESIERIHLYLEKLSYKKFLGDIKSQDAVVRNLEIIGEAAKKLSQDFKKKHSDIPWSDLAKTRDKLIHHYSGVNLDIVWDICRIELSRLKQSLKKGH